MPSKTKEKNAAVAARTAALPKIPKEVIDQFVSGPMSAEAVQATSMAFNSPASEAAIALSAVSIASSASCALRRRPSRP